MSPSAITSLVPELEDLHKQIDAIVADARKLTAALTDRQFNWQPAPGRWSIAQCLSHLNVIGEMQLPRMQASIRAARERGLTGPGPYRHGAIGNYFIRLSEPPPKVKFRAPGSMAPQPEPPVKLVADFFALQDRLQLQFREANGVDLGRAKVQTPVVSWIHFTLGQSYALIAAHERRHLWQAWQIRNDPQFPAS